MIRILVVDDHPALRAGLQAVLDAEPGFVHAGACSGDEEGLWPALDTIRPDVVLLDVHLPGDDGLQLCVRIKQRVLAPKVILYSAHASPALGLCATLAGADAIVGKAAPARELSDAIRRVAAGERPLPRIRPEDVDHAARSARPEDVPLLGLLLAGTPPGDIAATLGLAAGALLHRVRRLLSDVGPPLAGSAGRAEVRAH